MEVLIGDFATEDRIVFTGVFFLLQGHQKRQSVASLYKGAVNSSCSKLLYCKYLFGSGT